MTQYARQIEGSALEEHAARALKRTSLLTRWKWATTGFAMQQRVGSAGVRPLGRGMPRTLGSRQRPRVSCRLTQRAPLASNIRNINCDPEGVVR